LKKLESIASSLCFSSLVNFCYSVLKFSFPLVVAGTRAPLC
jgi:hypothetical protein